MRILVVNFILMCGLLSAAPARQSDSPKDQPNQKKSSAQAVKNKPPDNASKAPETPAAEEHKPDAKDAASDKDKDKDKEEHYDVAEVAPIVTHHQITLNDKLLAYTATAGRLPIKREDGTIEAEMFFVAYILDGHEANRRPLTFAFNGGPGSASVWLHMGAL